ncbi:hypothetical protein Q4517_15160 [Tenacibaculum sp. 1_MG-2023]|nr:hypothetical protein [Tenacibaculum sp. 1_MG-2023]MDO6676879.1 hypothetical protein [Tenacibaculum sp. 1_MG-2023]
MNNFFILNHNAQRVWYMYNVETEGHSSIIALNILNKNRTIILSNISAFNKNVKNIDQ